ncbi:MAG: leucine-rich repeat domain-containing protein [Chlamydiota bacterium]
MPTELLTKIVSYVSDNKQELMPLRGVCKRFDAIICEMVFAKDWGQVRDIMPLSFLDTHDLEEHKKYIGFVEKLEVNPLEKFKRLMKIIYLNNPLMFSEEQFPTTSGGIHSLYFTKQQTNRSFMHFWNVAPIEESIKKSLCGHFVGQITGERIYHRLSVYQQKLDGIESLDLSEKLVPENAFIPVTPCVTKVIFLFKNLTTLNLSNNDIRQIPKELGNLTQLENLDLSHNSIHELPSELGNLIHLKSLDLRNNRDLENVPETFENLNNLENFQVSLLLRYSLKGRLAEIAWESS